MKGIGKLRTNLMSGVLVFAATLLSTNLATANHIQPDYPDFILDHNVPATVCQLWGGNLNLAGSLSYSQFGRVNNNHNFERLRVVCPISKNPQTSLASVEVSVTDNHPGNNSVGSIRCRLRKMSRHATNTNSLQLDTTSGLPGGTGEDVLYFPFVEHVATDGESEFFVLFCSIPARLSGTQTPSSIDSIKIMEYEHPQQ